MSIKQNWHIAVIILLVVAIGAVFAYSQYRIQKANQEILILKEEKEAAQKKAEEVYVEWQKDKQRYHQEAKQIEKDVEKKVISMSLSDLADAFNADLHGSSGGSTP
jgi:Tfp pilus assembly protein PilN